MSSDVAEGRPPILLVHGLIDSLRELVPVFAGRGAQAYAPDLLGYGAMRDVPAAEIGLRKQVDHLARWLDERQIARVCLVGHSVGGAVAMLFALGHPDRVASIVNVEGNFSLNDAFWSVRVAAMSAAETEAMLAGFQAEPARWLARSGIPAEPQHISAAERLLANQPASTIRATARSVVVVTGQADYDDMLRAVFAGPIPVHLLAGERSRAGWDVPNWARAAAASEMTLPGGHLMMLEDPAGFVAAVLDRA
jgi:lipase